MIPEEIRNRVDEIDKQIIALLTEREPLEPSTYITDFNGTTYVITKLAPQVILPNMQFTVEEQQQDGNVRRIVWPFSTTTG
jgi:hypothetical protein